MVEIGASGSGQDAESTLARLSDCKLTDVGVRVALRRAVLGDTDSVAAAIKEELGNRSSVRARSQHRPRGRLDPPRAPRSAAKDPMLKIDNLHATVGGTTILNGLQRR